MKVEIVEEKPAPPPKKVAIELSMGEAKELHAALSRCVLGERDDVAQNLCFALYTKVVSPR